MNEPTTVRRPAKVDTILSLIVKDFQSFLSSINLTDASLEKLVVGLAEILLSTLGGFEALLPASAAASQMTFTIGSHQLTVVPKHRTHHKFVKDWNAEAKAGGHSESSCLILRSTVRSER